MSNEEKKLYTDSLLHYKEQLNKIASQDSLTTIISGNSPNIKANINQAKEVIDAQLKHIIRLNNYPLIHAIMKFNSTCKMNCLKINCFNISNI